jgi:hypothetical protein
MNAPEPIADVLPRLENIREGLARWQELAERLTSDGDPVDDYSAGFLRWALGSLSRSLVAVDDDLEQDLAPEPAPISPPPQLELVGSLTEPAAQT